MLSTLHTINAKSCSSYCLHNASPVGNHIDVLFVRCWEHKTALVPTAQPRWTALLPRMPWEAVSSCREAITCRREVCTTNTTCTDHGHLAMRVLYARWGPYGPHFLQKVNIALMQAVWLREPPQTQPGLRRSPREALHSARCSPMLPESSTQGAVMHVMLLRHRSKGASQQNPWVLIQVNKRNKGWHTFC